MPAELVEHIIGLLFRLRYADGLREEVSPHLKSRTVCAIGVFIKS